MPKYRNIGRHPEDFPGGKSIGPGEEIELTEEEAQHPRVAQLLKDRRLLGLKDTSAKPAATSKGGGK